MNHWVTMMWAQVVRDAEDTAANKAKFHRCGERQATDKQTMDAAGSAECHGRENRKCLMTLDRAPTGSCGWSLLSCTFRERCVGTGLV